MVAMSFLNRSEEATVPSCPASETTTGAVVPLTVVTPKTFSIQVVPLTLSPALRRQITPSAVVTLLPAIGPKATLEKPLVLFASASRPAAILLLPVVLLLSAFSPIAVFRLPVVLLASARLPIAVL